MINFTARGDETVAEQKTNAMRILEQKKVRYKAHSYPHGDSPVDGLSVASLLGLSPEIIYKTLVLRGASGSIYVFDLPVSRELDLKKAAKAVKEKSVAMIRADEITTLTGYVRGGCSPVGMKKSYPTVIEEAALRHETIIVSAGKIGSQLELAPEDLAKLTRAKFADITTED